MVSRFLCYEGHLNLSQFFQAYSENCDITAMQFILLWCLFGVWIYNHLGTGDVLPKAQPSVQFTYFSGLSNVLLYLAWPYPGHTTLVTMQNCLFWGKAPNPYLKQSIFRQPGIWASLMSLKRAAAVMVVFSIYGSELQDKCWSWAHS